ILFLLIVYMIYLDILFTNTATNNRATRRVVGSVRCGYETAGGGGRLNFAETVPACRERLSDVEAASTGSFSDPSASGDLGL
ncbi:hypothetical protein, partial [Klebsiella pneumoniae]|uniref:hypothetical protein n=1 Tax=Klebsiella pneumoniae TaxID=573 RepID=UPI0030DC3E7B